MQTGRPLRPCTPLPNCAPASSPALKRLDLAAGLTEFPREIFDFGRLRSKYSTCRATPLRPCPTTWAALHQLQVLFCSDNQFTEVPAVLGQCPQLRMVGFKANQIRTLPAAALTPAPALADSHR